MSSLTEVREELAEKRQQMHLIFKEAGPDLDLAKVTYISGDTNAKAAEIRRREEEINHLAQEYDRLDALEQMRKRNEAEHLRMNAAASGVQFPGANGQEAKAFRPERLRETIEQHRGYKSFRDGTLRSVTLDLPATDFKALVTLTNINRQNTRVEPVSMALEERTVADLMLQGNTDGNTLEYYEETTVTNAATTVAEGAAKPESALGWTLRTENVRKIATWIPATKESLDDVAQLESMIRGRLAYMVQRVEETQLLTGNGVAPNLMGILNRTGIQTQAKGTDPTPDAIYKAMAKVRGSAGSGFAEPTGIVMHPNDWLDVKLLRTADGIYIWGNPSDEGPDRIWGLQVRQTTAMTENTALVGAFRPHAEVFRRTGIQVTLSTEHSTYFVENKVAILAEERLALAVYRPSAFATVTGI